MKEEPSTIELVHGLADEEGVVEAPTDISIGDSKSLKLPRLTWKNYNNPPARLLLTNTGHTVNVGGKWESNRSYLRDGPFRGQYVFAQMHFHWGPTDQTGSEHSVEGMKMPMELHVVHINRIYRSQEMALKENDGVAILIYVFKLQEEDNSDLDPIVGALPKVTLPHTSASIDSVPIEKVLVPFQHDYFMYWGSVSSPTCKHRILWLTCRVPLGISTNQLAQFRQIRDVNGQFMVKNFRETHPRKNQTLFHVNPSSKLDRTLLNVFPGHALAGDKYFSAIDDIDLELEGCRTEAGKESKVTSDERLGNIIASEGSETGKVKYADEAARRKSLSDSRSSAGSKKPRPSDIWADIGEKSPAVGPLQDANDRALGADGLVHAQPGGDDGYKSLEGTVLLESSIAGDILSLGRTESVAREGGSPGLGETYEAALSEVQQPKGVSGQDDMGQSGRISPSYLEGQEAKSPLECKSSHASSICLEDKEETDEGFPPGEAVVKESAAVSIKTEAEAEELTKSLKREGSAGGGSGWMKEDQENVSTASNRVKESSSDQRLQEEQLNEGYIGSNDQMKTCDEGAERTDSVGTRHSSGSGGPTKTTEKRKSGSNVLRDAEKVQGGGNVEGLEVNDNNGQLERAGSRSKSQATSLQGKGKAVSRERSRESKGGTIGSQNGRGLGSPAEWDRSKTSAGKSRTGSSTGRDLSSECLTAGQQPANEPDRPGQRSPAGRDHANELGGRSGSGSPAGREPSYEPDGTVIGSLVDRENSTDLSDKGVKSASAGENSRETDERGKAMEKDDGNVEEVDGEHEDKEVLWEEAHEELEGNEGTREGEGYHGSEGDAEQGGSAQDLGGDPSGGGGASQDDAGGQGQGGGYGGSGGDDKDGDESDQRGPLGIPTLPDGEVEEEEDEEQGDSGTKPQGIPAGEPPDSAGNTPRPRKSPTSRESSRAVSGECISVNSSKAAKGPEHGRAADGGRDGDQEGREVASRVGQIRDQDVEGGVVHADDRDGTLTPGGEPRAFGHEALGTDPQSAGGVAPTDAEVTAVVDPSVGPEGQILTADGTPVEGALGGTSVGPEGETVPPPEPVAFKYFHPEEMERKRPPLPTFINSVAVSPAIIHTKESLKDLRSTVPCHGQALKQYEEEKRLWQEQEAARRAAEEEALRFAGLDDQEWDDIVSRMAQKKKEARPPADDFITGDGWPHEPYMPTDPEAPFLSPVDLPAKDVAEIKLRPLMFDGHFTPDLMSKLSNTGETVEVRVLNPELTPTLHGGPLNDEYIFDSMHFHWSNGPTPDCLGSAHRVGGQRFCMELHMLHFKAEYRNKAEALRHQAGICAVAFMLHLSEVENAPLARLSRELPRIEAALSSVPLEHNALLCCREAARPHGYVTYPGTLIGRQDRLNVVWIVYREPIGMCCQNTVLFQKLRASSEFAPSSLLPTHELGDRPVLHAVP